jgi:hypothetical protein
MPILMLLRQYGLREYAITLAVAAIAGLGIAVLINSAAGGGAGEPAVLKTKAELAASSHTLPARVDRPAAAPVKARPAVKHHVRRHRRARKVHHVARPAPAPAPTRTSAPHLVAVRTPAPSPVSTPAPKPAPVVHKPAPAPKPAPSHKTGGGGGGTGQFDDSG